MKSKSKIDGVRLTTVMRGLAARSYQRNHPGATKAEAWAYAARNYQAFEEAAVTFLVLIRGDEETQAAAQAQVN